jgi:hypothetical protein
MGRAGEQGKISFGVTRDDFSDSLYDHVFSFRHF